VTYRAPLGLLVVAALLPAVPSAQDRLQTMPGYQQYQKITQESRDAVKTGALTVTWKDVKTFEYTHDGKRYSYDVTTRTAADLGAVPAAEGTGRGRGGRGGRGGPVRGRQFDTAESPDKKFRAVYRDADRNLYIVDAATNAETAVTTDGSRDEKTRSRTARRAGSTVRSSGSAPPCGGRPTAASSPTTGSTKPRCRITCCS
jgi:dipeptidyl-peptidase-4